MSDNVMESMESYCCGSCEILKRRIEELESSIKDLVEKYFICKGFNCIKNLQCVHCLRSGCYSCLEKRDAPVKMYSWNDLWYVCNECKDITDMKKTLYRFYCTSQSSLRVPTIHDERLDALEDRLDKM